MERIPHELRSAFNFFFEHGGFVDGYKAHGALALARAEASAHALGYVAQWSPDPEPDLSWMDDAGRAESHDVEVCSVYSRCPKCGELSRHPVESLGNIVDADASYRRVVEAALFAEYLATVEAGR